MRLEEYQQWLDAQFLDEEEQPAPAAVVETAAPAPAQERTAEPPAPSAAEPLYFVGIAQAPEAAAPAPEPVAQAAALPPPVEDTPAPVVTTSSGAPLRDGARFTQDVEVPSIERYFPFLRRSEAPPVPPAETEPRTPSEPAEIPLGRRSPVEELATAQAVPAPVPTAEPAPPPAAAQPALAGPATDARPAPAPTPPREQPRSEPAPTRAREPSRPEPDLPRTAPLVAVSQRRARYVRSVTPSAEQPSGPVALWSLVPKHIQVLIAMGSDEVTQNSYKRSFKESRLELIERLLDPTLSLEDTARLLNVCPTTVRRYTNRGLLRHQRTPGDQRRFKLSDVLAFLEAQSRTDGTSAQG